MQFHCWGLDSLAPQIWLDIHKSSLEEWMRLSFMQHGLLIAFSVMPDTSHQHYVRFGVAPSSSEKVLG